ncbi:hypothetical protein QFZ28_005960 [Neobacillus niacini]|uniref:hypothetical protein n=1 Tax=Neobacillus niacini TaxID=86668 RepID=UPI002786CF32|nr:hypothetical protein [Neobacillus niacini]MDQ1005382.1 hypothetical protein [Neobacillus niacini]
MRCFTIRKAKGKINNKSSQSAASFCLIILELFGSFGMAAIIAVNGTGTYGIVGEV